MEWSASGLLEPSRLLRRMEQRPNSMRSIDYPLQGLGTALVELAHVDVTPIVVWRNTIGREEDGIQNANVSGGN